MNNSEKFIEALKKNIHDKRIRVRYEECVTSTNTLLKELAENGEKEGLLLIAAEQSEGKGRLGRSFLSKKGTGIYFSLLLRPQINPCDALLITTNAAVAVSKALDEAVGCKSQIKWVNDIIVGNKKVCGILTQSAFATDKLSYAVLGIGINIYFPENSLPKELEGIAGAVFDSPDVPDDVVARIVALTVDNFMNEYDNLSDKKFLDYYKTHSYLDSKNISVIKPDCVRDGVALGVNDDFSLEVMYENGDTESLFTGEVSTKIKRM